MSKFEELKPGDNIIRRMSRDGPSMKMVVLAVDDSEIYCSPGEREPNDPLKDITLQQCKEAFEKGLIWKFDRKTGAEIDEELGWGPQFGVTGTYLELEAA